MEMKAFAFLNFMKKMTNTTLREFWLVIRSQHFCEITATCKLTSLRKWQSYLQTCLNISKTAKP